MSPISKNEHLKGITRAIFHVIARTPELRNAEEHIIELLGSLLGDALAAQQTSLINTLVEALSSKELPACHCGRGVDRLLLVRILRRAFDDKQHAAPEAN
jgi:hypothetical protein